MKGRLKTKHSKHSAVLLPQVIPQGSQMHVYGIRVGWGFPGSRIRPRRIARISAVEGGPCLGRPRKLHLLGSNLSRTNIFFLTKEWLCSCRCFSWMLCLILIVRLSGFHNFWWRSVFPRSEILWWRSRGIWGFGCMVKDNGKWWLISWSTDFYVCHCLLQIRTFLLSVSAIWNIQI